MTDSSEPPLSQNKSVVTLDAPTAQILDGKQLSQTIIADLKAKVASMERKPRLDVIVAVEDPASVAYVNMKKKMAQELGITGMCHNVRSDTTERAMEDLIDWMNVDPKVDGVLIQHPLPRHLDEKYLFSLLRPEKDVDGITPSSIGLLASGVPGHRAATPHGVMTLLKHYGIEFYGKNTLVIGCSVILGKPMSLMLMEAEATVTVAQKSCQDLESLVREADIVVSATGVPLLVKGSWIKPGAVVVDCGYSKVNGKTVGDVEFHEAAKRASWITPVPGGVGPMTVATLLSNVVDARLESLI